MTGLVVFDEGKDSKKIQSVLEIGCGWNGKNIMCVGLFCEEKIEEKIVVAFQ